jgi:hypothetical protein
MVTFDDGRGPALYAGAGFTTFAGQPIPKIARWDGSTWSSVGTPPIFIVQTMVVFDDGSGAALYAAGESGLGSGPVVARWDGTTWSIIGGSFTGTRIHKLVVGNDGTGPALYAGGSFSLPTSNIAKWNGSAWVGLGAGSSGTVDHIVSFDDGNGHGVYATGLFAGGASLAKWNGSAWATIPGFSFGGLAAYDDGNGTALYAGGYSTLSFPGLTTSVARWNGTAWVPIGAISGTGSSNARVTALGVVDEASGRSLYVGGTFRVIGGVTSRMVARWNAAGWSGMGAGLTPNLGQESIAQPKDFAFYDDGGGRAVFVATIQCTAPSGDTPIGKWGCPFVCGTRTYGNGLGGANVALLDSSSSARIGTTVVMDISGFQGSGLCFVALALNSGVVPGLLGGTVLLDLASIGLTTATPVTNGVGSYPVAIPNVSAFIGLHIYSQAAMFDGTSPAGWALTNGLETLTCP